LSWAIEQSGYTREQIAAKLDIDMAKLDAWENNNEKPNLTSFKNLANTLKRPSALFFLPEPPKSPSPPVEFRHPPSARSVLNPNERRYLREVTRLQRTVAWILSELGKPPVDIPQIQLGSDVERAAESVRQQLKVAVGEQLRWQSSSMALKEWRDALEETGVLVFLLQLGKDSCRGFSLWDDRAPVIASNTWWNPEARIYTLFHEYAHLLTRTNSVCIQNGGKSLAPGSDAAERWCEQFAAALLLPWDEVQNFMGTELDWFPGRRISDLDSIRKVGRHFKVSLRALTLRLIGKNAATWELYEKIPSWSDEKRGGGGGSGRRRAQAREDTFGSRAIDVFLTAIREDLVSRADALSYLDIPDSDLERFERYGVRSSG
jgi:Zn-dependent peptidase ImmA (M78 family)/DNA-binding XRE family transcriptional regulator